MSHSQSDRIAALRAYCEERIAQCREIETRFDSVLLIGCIATRCAFAEILDQIGSLVPPQDASTDGVLNKVAVKRNGDELRIETPWMGGKRLILLSWWRLKKTGVWGRMKKADAMALIGLDELEQMISALEKARDWIKETGG